MSTAKEKEMLRLQANYCLRAVDFVYVEILSLARHAIQAGKLGQGLCHRGGAIGGIIRELKITLYMYIGF